jgi:hypothetical protein
MLVISDIEAFTVRSNYDDITLILNLEHQASLLAVESSSAQYSKHGISLICNR